MAFRGAAMSSTTTFLSNQELTAIRARHENTRRNECLTTTAGYEAYDDRAALLAEVDRLQQEVDALSCINHHPIAVECDRLRAALEAAPDQADLLPGDFGKHYGRWFRNERAEALRGEDG